LTDVTPAGRFRVFRLAAITVVFVSLSTAAAATGPPPGVVQYTTKDGPLKQDLDFLRFRAAIDGLTSTRAAAIARVARNGSLAGIEAALRAGTFTSEELTTWYLARIQRYDAGRYNSVLELNPDALTIARAADATRTAGKATGRLHGIPVLVKGNISTADKMHTSAGAAALADHRVDRDSFIVTELRDAGAVIIGKANLSEWSNLMTSNSISGYSALGGFTRNPYGRFDVSGSSSGSAVAAAASFAAVAVGTETHGSIIAPSKANNVVGLKPTLGLVSRDRIIPISDEQDTAGPIGRSVADVAALLTVLAGKRDAGDAKSSRAARLIGHDFTADTARPVKGLRVGVVGAGAKRRARLNKISTATGIVFVDIPRDSYDAAVRDVDGAPDERMLLAVGMKYGVDDYLRATHAGGPAASLAAVVAYNERDLDARAPYGQDLLEYAATSRMSRAQWRRQAAKLRAIRQKQARRLLSDFRLDAVLDQDVGYPAAGFPSIVIPTPSLAGRQPTFLQLTGDALSEPKLIAIAAAIERLQGSRRAPRLTQKPIPARS
jgi:amidase